MSSFIQTLFPVERDVEIPPQVDGFLHTCELATSWYSYQDLHHEDLKVYFCEGVVDYWHGDYSLDPSFDQLFHRPLGDDRCEGWPSSKRFAYQQGAIVGNELREEYG